MSKYLTIRFAHCVCEQWAIAKQLRKMMLLGEREIKNSKRKLSKISQKIEEKSSFHYFCSDPTRLKIIFLLKNHKKLCPTDLSQILNISISAVSHQLSLLERAGLARRVKMGRMVCYSLTEKIKKILN